MKLLNSLDFMLPLMISSHKFRSEKKCGSENVLFQKYESRVWILDESGFRTCFIRFLMFGHKAKTLLGLQIAFSPHAWS